MDLKLHDLNVDLKEVIKKNYSWTMVGINNIYRGGEDNLYSLEIRGIV